MAPLAPGRFSATTGWPRRCVSQSAVMRASESVTPPGGKGTMTLTGFCGQFCAGQAPETARRSKEEIVSS